MTIATMIADVAADALPGLLGISAALIGVTAVLVVATTVTSLALLIRREHPGAQLAVVCLVVVVLLTLARIVITVPLGGADDDFAATNLPLIGAAALSVVAVSVALRTRTRT